MTCSPKQISNMEWICLTRRSHYSEPCFPHIPKTSPPSFQNTVAHSVLIAKIILTATGFPKTTEILSKAKPGLDRKTLNLNLGLVPGCPSEGPSLTPTLLAQILWRITQRHPSDGSCLGAARHVHYCQQNPDNWTSLGVQWLRIHLEATWEARNGKYCLVTIKRPFSSSKYFILLLLLLSYFSRVQLCDPIDGSPPDSAIPGILQARTLEWAAISFSIHQCIYKILAH